MLAYVKYPTVGQNFCVIFSDPGVGDGGMKEDPSAYPVGVGITILSEIPVYCSSTS